MQTEFRQPGVDQRCQPVQAVEEPFAAGQIQEQCIGRFDRHDGREANHPPGQAMQPQKIFVGLMFLVGEPRAQRRRLRQGHAGIDAGLTCFFTGEGYELARGDSADENQRYKMRSPKPEIRRKSQVRNPNGCARI